MAHAKDVARTYGYSIRKRDGEYLVDRIGAREGRATYYTNDLSDALDTAKAMAGPHGADLDRQSRTFTPTIDVNPKGGNMRKTGTREAPELSRRVTRPGKFEGEVEATEIAWDATADGADEDFGDAGEGETYYGLVCNLELPSGHTTHAIVSEDSQGFVSARFFDTAAAAKKVFRQMERRYNTPGIWRD